MTPLLAAVFGHECTHSGGPYDRLLMKHTLLQCSILPGAAVATVSVKGQQQSCLPGYCLEKAHIEKVIPTVYRIYPPQISSQVTRETGAQAVTANTQGINSLITA